MTHDLDQRVHFAIDLARGAGELGLKYFRDLDNLTIESKGHQDLVSDGDREVELFIRAAIAAAYPQDGIVGEEHASVAGTTGYVWVIDPIDGTANFVRGIPAWCVVIACARDGETVVGVIHEPSTGETFHGRRGAPGRWQSARAGRDHGSREGSWLRNAPALSRRTCQAKANPQAACDSDLCASARISNDRTRAA